MTKTAYYYCHVGSAGQDRKSLERQRQLAEEWCKRNGCEMAVGPDHGDDSLAICVSVDRVSQAIAECPSHIAALLRKGHRIIFLSPVEVTLDENATDADVLAVVVNSQRPYRERSEEQC